MDNSSIKLKSYAKVNFSLYITGLRSDRYHLIDSIFTPIDLYDVVSLKKIESGIEIKCNVSSLSVSSNTAYKAVHMIKQEYGDIGGIEINIEKNIPQMAGLGGGSANAAATLVGMNALYDLKMDKQKLKDFALKIGADVPFFLETGACRVQGIGDIVTPIDMKINAHMVIIKPKSSLSTERVYNRYDSMFSESAGNCDDMVENIKKDDIRKISEAIHNDLQKVAIQMIPSMQMELDYLKSKGAINAIMTGSGTCVFGIFQSHEEALEASNYYNGNGKAYCVNTIEKPICVI